MIYGQQQFGTGLYGADLTALTSPSADGLVILTDANAIVFNGYVLQDSEIITNLFDRDNPASKKLVTEEIPRRSGKVVLSDFYSEKIIQLDAVVEAESRSAMDLKLRAMKNALKKTNGWLQFMDAGENMIVKCTWTNRTAFNRARYYGNTFCVVTLEFEAVDPPFIQSLDFVSQSFFGVTLLNYIEDITVEGNVDEMQPVAIMNVTAADSITNVQFENSTTGQAINVDVSLTAGDILKFDAQTRKVYKNGTKINFNGDFPDLHNGTNSTKIVVTGTSITYDLTLKYKNFYL